MLYMFLISRLCALSRSVKCGVSKGARGLSETRVDVIVAHRLTSFHGQLSSEENRSMFLLVGISSLFSLEIRQDTNLQDISNCRSLEKVPY